MACLGKGGGQQGVYGGSYEEGGQGREHEPPPVLGELVVAAMEAKVQRYGPVAARMCMENVPASAAQQTFLPGTIPAVVPAVMDSCKKLV